MEQTKAVEAARLLVEARRTGNPIKELPQEVRPLVAADFDQIVDEINKMLGHDIAGWKITFLYKPREVPFQAPLYSHLVFSSPAKIPVSLTPSLFIEPEITFPSPPTFRRAPSFIGPKRWQAWSRPAHPWKSSTRGST